MGPSGISIWQLLIVLAIALCVFGTNRLKNVGADLGGAIKGFRKAMEDETRTPARAAEAEPALIAEERQDTAAAAQAEEVGKAQQA